MRVGSLFSGIGGLDLGLERAGMRIVWQCEIDSYCRQVLRKHWPYIPCYEDVHKLEYAPAVDLICGGFPCQPVSIAGKRGGKTDERWLWPEMRRIVANHRPRWVVIENVRGIATRGLAEILEDLEALGYQGTPYLTSACAFGATHKRERVFVVANPLGRGTGLETHRDRRQEWGFSNTSAPAMVRQGNDALGAEGDAPRLEFPRWSSICGWDAPTPLVRRVDDGVPQRVDRVRALGNSVVPQVAEYIGRLIMESA